MNARGWCKIHLERWKRHGDPLVITRPGKREIDRWMDAHVLWLDKRDCLAWPYSISEYGYPVHRHTFMHREMCKRAHGEPPTASHHAAHSCGNSKCINPNHLRWATPQENIDDKKLHGTYYVGSKVGTAKLVESQVLEIRRLQDLGASNREIADRFSVSSATASFIRTRKRWGWLE